MKMYDRSSFMPQKSRTTKGNETKNLGKSLEKKMRQNQRLEVQGKRLIILKILSTILEMTVG